MLVCSSLTDAVSASWPTTRGFIRSVAVDLRPASRTTRAPCRLITVASRVSATGKRSTRPAWKPSMTTYDPAWDSVTRAVAAARS